MVGKQEQPEGLHTCVWLRSTTLGKANSFPSFQGIHKAFWSAGTPVSMEMQAFASRSEQDNKNTSLKVCTYVSLLLSHNAGENPKSCSTSARHHAALRNAAGSWLGAGPKPQQLFTCLSNHCTLSPKNTRNLKTQKFLAATRQDSKTKPRLKPTNEGKKNRESRNKGWLTPPVRAVSRITYSENKDAARCSAHLTHDNCSTAPTLELHETL